MARTVLGLLNTAEQRRSPGLWVLAVVLGLLLIVMGMLVGGFFLQALVELVRSWWPVLPPLPYWTAVVIMVLFEVWVCAAKLFGRLMGQDPSGAANQRCEVWRLDR